MEEMKGSMFDLRPNNAPNLNSFSGDFFTTCWDIMSQDTYDAVLDLFRGETLPKSYTSSHHVLIPKGEHSYSLHNFRPINFCNFTYNIISLLICKRLSYILSNLISPL